jgi:hypothetical protein
MPPPVSFDPERYLRIQSGAVDLADELYRAVRRSLAAGAQNHPLTTRRYYKRIAY